MDDDTDFTFCQVGSRGDNDCLQSPETIPNISGITLEDDNIDGMIIHKVSDSIKDDSSHISGTSEDLGAKGSPASTNIDTLQTSAKRNESLKEKGEREAAVLLSHLQENKPAVKKNVVRAKVPFEKGYSQMDWLKLTRTDPYLAGLKGQSNRRLVSLDEVRQHKTDWSIWTVLEGRVYNISPYMKFHPGGVDMLMKAAGRDCTALFNKYHAWVNAELLLEKCLVGILEDSS